MYTNGASPELVDEIVAFISQAHHVYTLKASSIENAFLQPDVHHTKAVSPEVE